MKSKGKMRDKREMEEGRRREEEQREEKWGTEETPYLDSCSVTYLTLINQILTCMRKMT